MGRGGEHDVVGLELRRRLGVVPEHVERVLVDLQIGDVPQLLLEGRERFGVAVDRGDLEALVAAAAVLKHHVEERTDLVVAEVQMREVGDRTAERFDRALLAARRDDVLPRRNEGAAAVADVEDVVLGQLLVGALDRAAGDVERRREFALGRHLVAGLELAGHHPPGDLLDELPVDRSVVLLVDRKFLHRDPLPPKCGSAPVPRPPPRDRKIGLYL